MQQQDVAATTQSGNPADQKIADRIAAHACKTVDIVKIAMP